MIRINLLPSEDRPKRREFKLPNMSTVYMVGGIAMFVTVILVVALVQHGKVRSLEGKIEVAKEESKKLAPQLAKIKQITKEREEVDRRLALITSTPNPMRPFILSIRHLRRFPAGCTWVTPTLTVIPILSPVSGA